MTTITSRRALTSTLAAALLAGGARPALAQRDYPRRPIRVVVPFAAGGGQDEFARRFIPVVGGEISRLAIIENRPGGNSILATEAVVRSASDGYTLLQQTNSFTANPALTRQLPYDTSRDLAPISLVARTPHVLIVRHDFPASDLAGFLAHARASRGGLNYGTAGVGSTTHLAALMLAKAAGLTLENVVYRGASEFTNDLLGGRIDFVISGSSQATALARSGQVRALAVTAASRIAGVPEVPTFREHGLDVELYSWTGYLAPARTPPAIIAVLSEAFQATCREASIQARFPDHELAGSSPEEFAAFLAQDIATSADLLRGLAS